MPLTIREESNRLLIDEVWAGIPVNMYVYTNVWRRSVNFDE